MSRKFFQPLSRRTLSRRTLSRRTLSHAVQPLGTKSSAQLRPITRPLAALVLAVICCGCGTSSEQEAATADMVFVDIKSGEVMLLEPSSEVPVANPNTGQRTMMPALYCDKCQRWYPVPPAEQMNRSQGAGLCPKHRTPLVADGPHP